MIGARGANWSGLARHGAIALLALLLAPPARANADDGAAEPAPPCETDDDACKCAREATCWDLAFLSSGKTTLLGMTATLTALSQRDDDRFETGVLVNYRAEAYRTRDKLSSHVVVFGALGAGSAGTEGALGGAIDFGVRVPISLASGPVVRIGPNGWWIGHDALRFSLLEPLRLSAGFQRLIGGTLFEGGVTTGLLGSGRFAAGDRSTALAGAFELGHYLAVQLDAFRFDGRVIYLQPWPFEATAELAIVQLEACVYPHPVAACVDVRFFQSQLPERRPVSDARESRRQTARVLYSGVTLGLTP
jgi:hypothetical protein